MSAKDRTKDRAKDQAADLTSGQVADELYRGHRLFKAFENAIGVIEKLKAAEQLEVDARRRAHDMQAEYDETVKGVGRARETAQAIVARAQEDAKGIISAANVGVRQMNEAANASLAKELESQNHAQLSASLANAEVAARSADLKDLNEQIAAAEAKLKRVNADIAKVVAKLGA